MARSTEEVTRDTIGNMALQLIRLTVELEEAQEQLRILTEKEKKPDGGSPAPSSVI